MIHIGTMNWPKTVETGDFYCPICDTIGPFRRRVSRPFLTVYFIPIIPIGGLQEYVQCLSCKEQMPPMILGPIDNTPRTFQSDLLTAIALTITADGYVSDAEIDRALLLYQKFAFSIISRADLAAACSGSSPHLQQGLGNFLYRSRTNWDFETKSTLVQAIFLLASTEGEISRTKLRLLGKLDRLLDLSQDDVAKMVVDAEQLKLE